jgi:hypothetical protein
MDDHARFDLKTSATTSDLRILDTAGVASPRTLATSIQVGSYKLSRCRDVAAYETGDGTALYAVSTR